MSGGHGQNGFRFTRPSKSFCQSLQDSRDGARTRGHVTPYPDVVLTKLSRHHAKASSGGRIFRHSKIFRQPFVKAPVNLTDSVRPICSAAQAPAVNPLLNLD